MLVSNIREVGANLQAARKRAQLTQEQAADLAKLSNRGYAAIERGDTCMRIDTMLDICRALDITPDELFTSPGTYRYPQMEDIIDEVYSHSHRVQENVAEIISLYLGSRRKPGSKPKPKPSPEAETPSSPGKG